MASGLAAGLGLTALAGVAWLAAAPAPAEPRPDPTVAPAVDPTSVPARAPFVDGGAIANAVAAGAHHRIEGPRGPIHVWIPAGYRPETGATIVYVHGLYDTADTAWTGHQLPQQFALSAANALFVVPEAPVQARVPVNYPDLGELLRLVEERTGAIRGAALTAVLGHSGAFRTIERWLDEPLVDQIAMVDAMYGDEEPILTWFNASPRRRLISIGQDTVLGTESLSSKIAETVTLERFPPSYDTWPAAARTARHVYIRSQFGHMPLVTEGIALPSLIRLLPVELLADQPWQLPLGSLPPLSAAPAPGAVVDAGASN